MSKTLVSELLKQLDREIRTNKILSELNNYVEIKDSLDAIIKHIKEISDCDAIGIRLYDGKDYPFYAYEGIEPSYRMREQAVCANNPSLKDFKLPDKSSWSVGCLCREVIEGKRTKNLPFFTAKGSFWVNNFSSFVFSRDVNCLYYGYESLAFIPITSDSKCIGLIQLFSNRSKFTLEMVLYLEMIGNYISKAIANHFAYSKMKRTYESLTQLIPICSYCKSINTEEEHWQPIEKYFHEQIGAEFTHTICPDCMQSLYPDVYAKIKEKYDSH